MGEITDLQQLEDLSTLTRKDYVAKYGGNHGQWADLRAQLGVVGRTKVVFPPAELPLLAPELVYPDADAVLVAADWHVPHHDTRMAEALCSVGAQERVTLLVLCGDVLNEDVFFKGGNEKLPAMVSFKEELTAARGVLKVLLGTFDRIVWLAGNHEQRLFRASKGELDMDTLLSLVAGRDHELDASRVDVTDRDYVLLDHPDPNYRWRITHGVGGSAMVSTNAAVTKAEVYGCNVAQGHNHLIGSRQTRGGRHLGMDIGCMLRPEWIAYKALNTKPYPTWNQGFLLLRDGRPTQFSRRWSEWKRYGIALD